MIKRSIYFLLLWVACSNAYAQTLTIPHLLKEMTDFEQVTVFPDPAFTIKQSSSYDRRSIAADKPGWFANGDFNQFIRKETKNEHDEYVMLDAEGPGAIVRFWLTTLAKEGTMRFYFDNEENASLLIPGFDLMRANFDLGPALLNPHSSYEPNGKGGNTLYFPLLFGKHCKVTWQFADSANIKTPHYYQINYKLYAKSTAVETFKKDQLVKYKSAIDKAEESLWHPVSKKGKQMSETQMIKAGNKHEMILPSGTNAIQSFTLQLNPKDQSNFESMWRSLIINIVFDDQETVRCPLGDFIGSGYGNKPIRSWYREMTIGGKLISRWIMPYQKTAKITIMNQSLFDVSVDITAAIVPYKWNKSSMYFHASNKEEKNIKDARWDYDVTKVASLDTSAPIEWNFIRIKGKGVYMGNTLAVDNHMDAWYGEGDNKVYVDGESFPSEFGTGLEDYYNTSWAPVVLYQTPFANAPRADNTSSKGHNTFTRTRNLDRIPFNTVFAYDMEMLSWNGGTIDASATVYWYGAPGAAIIK